MAKKRKIDPKAAHQHRQKPNKQAKVQSKRPAKLNSSPPIPFEAEDRILLIGEGDFSFSKSIVEHHGCYDVTATCLDNREGLLQKYDPQAEDNTAYLEGEGQTVVYAVDATKLDSNPALKKTATGAGAFDRIIFNFPHIGGKTKDVNRQVRLNQELLVKFFSSSIALLTSNGTIIVTLFEGSPYSLWNIKDLARHAGLEVQRSFKFVAETYPGYSHSRTLGNIEGGGGWKGEDRDARSFVFQRKGSRGQEAQEGVGGRGKKRKKRGEDESSDEGG